MDWKIHLHEKLSSTQDEIKTLAQNKKAREGTVVQALCQTNGRGTHGRKWISSKGGLYVSILLLPQCETKRIGEISLMAAAATANAIQGSAIKWPNDIMINGHKAAGILLESDTSHQNINWIAIGIGANISNAPDNRFAAINGDLFDVRDKVLHEIGATYDLWKTKGFEPIAKLWLKRCQYKLGDAVRSSTHNGKFGGIDENGALILLS